MLRKFTLLISCLLFIVFKSAAQFASLTPLTPIDVSTTTGEKPQSKVWYYEGKYWVVLPNNNGTHLWRLDGTSWTNALKLSDNSTSKADCKLVGNKVHILLYQGRSSELVSIEYVSNAVGYQFWSERSNTVKLSFDSGVETATIEVDGSGRMWLASDGNNTILVRWSDSPYDTWSAAIPLANNITNDDISAIIAMPGKIGVFWSNQNTKSFGFSTHTDGDPPASWSADEVPASQSAIDVNGGMADDHMNLAVSSDGTLFCSIKTSYDNTNFPEIALLVRQPNGSWDDLYEVSSKGTRPIVILNEEASKVVVIYTASDTGGNILYRESKTDNIEFGEVYTLISGGNYNNSTSTKANYSGETLILASSNSKAVGVLVSDPTVPLPVELLSFSARSSGSDAILEWVTASEINNDYFVIEASSDGATYTALGTIDGQGTTIQQNKYTFTDANILRYRAPSIYYRLKQVDFSGEFTLSTARVVHAGALAQTLKVEAYPNPFNSYLKILIESPQEEQAVLMLHTKEGKAVYSESLTLMPGQNRLQLQNTGFESGLYILSIRTQKENKVVKLIQQ